MELRKWSNNGADRKDYMYRKWPHNKYAMHIEKYESNNQQQQQGEQQQHQQMEHKLHMAIEK